MRRVLGGSDQMLRVLQIGVLSGAFIIYGIIQQYSAAYTYEQNGLIERINKTILEKVRCLLFTIKLLKYLWGEAVSTAVYIYNRTLYSQI
jgi:hypothetical protein